MFLTSNWIASRGFVTPGVCRCCGGSKKSGRRLLECRQSGSAGYLTLLQTLQFRRPSDSLAGSCVAWAHETSPGSKGIHRTRLVRRIDEGKSEDLGQWYGADYRRRRAVVSTVPSFPPRRPLFWVLLVDPLLCLPGSRPSSSSAPMSSVPASSHGPSLAPPLPSPSSSAPPASRSTSRWRRTVRIVGHHAAKHTGVGIVCAVAYFDP